MPAIQRAVQKERAWPSDPVTGVILGAEAFSFGEGAHAVLFLHGWHSSPREVRFLAQRFQAAGFHCRGPLLKGHGTRIQDLAVTRFPDYLAEAETAFDALSATHERVSICGLSMGGLLGLDLASRLPVANLVLIAPFLAPTGTTFGLPNRWLIGRVPLWGNIAKSLAGPIQDPAGREGHISYHAMPAQAMVSVVVAARRFAPLIPKVHCPTLILHSIHDTTSDFAGSKLLIEKLGSEDKTLVAYNRGNHVITLDYPRESLETTAVAWLRQRRSRSPS
ncbi:MAG: esterase [Fibrobacteres bacterium]|nr:esterase [Fibrobacterota bacterium]